MQDAQKILADLLDEMADARCRLTEETRNLAGAARALDDLERLLDARDRASDGTVPERLRELREHIHALRASALGVQSDRLRRWADGIAASAESLRHMTNLATLGELSASVAHEIRNPLCGIQLLVEVLQTKMDADDSRSALLGNLRREAERMAKVVNNLLHFARHYEPNTAPCRLGDVARRSIEALRAHLVRSQIEVIIQGPVAECEAELDADLVLQVFRNMLLNSVDASARGSKLHIRLFGPNEAGEVAVAFCDEGQGIGPDLIDRIFDPFFTSKPNGVGLGLSVSKKIVEAHNGRIEVESEPGKGTTFTVIFPPRAAERRQRLAA